MDDICGKIGIRKRTKPGSPYLNKKELLTLNGWISTTTAKLAAAK